MQPLQMLLEKMRGTTPRLLDASTLTGDDHTEHEERHTRSFSSAFHDFAEQCLRQHAPARPTAAALQLHPFLRQLRKVKRPLRDMLGAGLRPITAPASPPTNLLDDSTLLAISDDGGVTASVANWYL